MDVANRAGAVASQENHVARATSPRAFHPLLLAIYPILFLYSRNMDQVGPGVMVVPLLVSLAVTGVLWLIFQRFARNKTKAAVALSGLLIWFFSYGHVYMAGGNGMSQRILLPCWMLLLAAGGLLLRKMRDVRSVSAVFNVLAAALIASVGLQIGLYALHARRQNAAAFASTLPVAPTGRQIGPKRDIYYLLLDSYAGAQTLQEQYFFDNTPFLNELRKRGFVVATHSHSNYPFTLTSMPATLNMEYNDGVSQQVGVTSRDMGPLKMRVRENAVMRFLRAQGYICQTIDSPGDMDPIGFSQLLIQTTLLVCIRSEDAQQWRTRTLAAFDRLAHLPAVSQPRFVYAHIYCPHRPFVFGPNGEEIPFLREQLNLLTTAEIRQRYIDQMTYVGKRALEIVDTLQAHAKNPPIIIIQADHGPVNLSPPWPPTDACVQERFGILNAYCLPGAPANVVYDSITPVNSFRVIFHHYFGADFPPLPDKNYYCTQRAPYKYLDVTHRIK